MKGKRHSIPMPTSPLHSTPRLARAAQILPTAQSLIFFRENQTCPGWSNTLCSSAKIALSWRWIRYWELSQCPPSVQPRPCGFQGHQEVPPKLLSVRVSQTELSPSEAREKSQSHRSVRQPQRSAAFFILMRVLLRKNGQAAQSLRQGGDKGSSFTRHHQLSSNTAVCFFLALSGTIHLM